MLQRYTLYFNYPNLLYFCCEFETEFFVLEKCTKTVEIVLEKCINKNITI